MEKEEPKLKILMFPWLAHGHIHPFLELAKRLSARSFCIYLCSTRVNLDSISSHLGKAYPYDDNDDDDASIKLVELQIPPSPELPPEMLTTKNMPPHLMSTLLKAFQTSSSSFLDIIDFVKPDLLIYDMFQPWAPTLASSRGIPSVYCAICGATPFSYYHHFFTKGRAVPYPYEAIYLHEHEWIEGNSIKPHLKGIKFYEYFHRCFSMSRDIVLMSGTRPLEEKYLDYLSVLSKKQIVLTGPLITIPDSNGHEDDHKQNMEILEWLSEKPLGSTIFISFGSEMLLSDEQIIEIAKGLQLSNSYFLWVLRSPTGDEAFSIKENLPEWFLETTKDRGMIVTWWAPQAKILRHPSIGAFVSQCGWNSTIESVYHGVPVIAMPMQYEQPINARLLVEAGVAVEVEKGRNGIYSGKDMAMVIDKVMVEKEVGERMREKAKKLMEKIKRSGEMEMDEAHEELVKMCLVNKKQQV